MTGSGKTRLVFYEIAKLKYLKNPYTQFAYVTDEDNDKTYLKYKDLISIPIIKVKYKDANTQINNILNAKNLYEKIIDGKTNGISECCRKSTAGSGYGKHSAESCSRTENCAYISVIR
jgi:hypothetical protein